MGFLGRLQAKLELYRLEQRYTRREKRTTFFSDAQYVDGEYIYSPTSPKSMYEAGQQQQQQQQRWAPKHSPAVGIREVQPSQRV